MQKKKILAIASGGGHWVQLLRLRPAFNEADVVYATVKEGYHRDVDDAPFSVVPNANRWDKVALIKSAISILFLILKERPQVVISTGAAVGFFAVRFAKFLGIKTIWVDSIANAEELSLSGKKAGAFVDLWLTQWEHLATENGPHYYGSVI